jgi:Domain of unknown function (DUF4252)
MTTLIKIILTAFLLLLFGCNNQPSLQKYFVEKSNDTQFSSFDLSPSLLKSDNKILTQSQTEALKAFKKVNVLIHKNDKNSTVYEAENKAIKQILAQPEYQALVKIGSKNQAAQLSFVGTDDNIEEFIIYGSQKQNGLALVRISGENMSINHAITLLGMVRQGNFDQEKLKPLLNLFQNKL